MADKTTELHIALRDLALRFSEAGYPWTAEVLMFAISIFRRELGER